MNGNNDRQPNRPNQGQHISHQSHSSHSSPRPIIPPRGDYQTHLSFQKAQVVYAELPQPKTKTLKAGVQHDSHSSHKSHDL